MRRTQRGPALFELLEQDVGTKFKPFTSRWWRKPVSPSATEVKAEAIVAAEPAISPAPVPDPVVVATVDEDGWIAVDGDRIRLSLTSIASATVVFVFVLAVLVAFGIGARRGESKGLQKGYAAGSSTKDPKAPDEIQTVRNQKPATYLISDIASGAPAAKKNPTVSASEVKPPASAKQPAPNPAPNVAATSTGDDGGKVQWVRDQTYIVAQEMPANAMPQAKAAQEFLARGGVQATIVQPNDRSILLITTRGYNHKDANQKKQSEQLLDKIRSLGTQYYSSGGGYKLEGYFKTLKRDTW